MLCQQDGFIKNGLSRTINTAVGINMHFCMLFKILHQVLILLFIINIIIGICFPHPDIIDLDRIGIYNHLRRFYPLITEYRISGCIRA